MDTDANSASVEQGQRSLDQRVESAVETAQQRVAGAIRPAAEQAQSFAERQKTLGAEQIGGVARAVHSAAREFEGQMPIVAKSVHDAAARLEGAAASLRDQSPGELISGLNRFAREQPAVFFGAAILAGFAASRFLKSTAETSSGA
jgi:hypothetical protein